MTAVRPESRERRTGLVAVLTRAWLPAWFVGWDVTIIVRLLWPHSVGVDGALYSVAAAAWLRGGDPWAVFDGSRLAAPPPTLVPFILTAWLPAGVAGFVWVGVGAIAAFFAIRRLGLPLWWLCFPPLVVAVWQGSIEPVVLLLLVAGPRFMAPILKLYAALPLMGEGRWRALIVAVVIVLVTIPLMPWSLYLAQLGDIQAANPKQGFGIAENALTPATALTVVALCVLGRRRAGYLAIPTLWPSAHFHYATLAIPVLASVPLVAAGASMVGAPYAIQAAVIAAAILATVNLPRRRDSTGRAGSWRDWIVGRWRGQDLLPPGLGHDT